jgi:hypothetical protein
MLLYLCDDIFLKIVCDDISIDIVIPLMMTSNDMRTHLRRIISPLPLQSLLNNTTYLALLVKASKLPKNILKYYYNKAIREGYFPIIYDFSPFSRKMKMSEFIDIMADVSPYSSDSYLTHMISHATKVAIAEYYLYNSQYIETNSNIDQFITDAAYNLLTNTGDLMVAGYNDKPLAIMFANCSDEVINNIFAKRKKGYYFNKFARIYGRESLYDVSKDINKECIYKNVVNYPSTNNLIFVNNTNIETDITNFNIHKHPIVLDAFKIKCGLKMYPVDTIIKYINICKISDFYNFKKVYKLLVPYDNKEILETILNKLFELFIHIDEDEINKTLKEIIAISKSYYNIVSLHIIGETIQWQEPLTLAKFEAFKKKLL